MLGTGSGSWWRPCTGLSLFQPENFPSFVFKQNVDSDSDMYFPLSNFKFVEQDSLLDITEL